MRQKASTIDRACDGIETAILLALSAKNKGATRSKVTKGKAGWDRLENGMEIFCPRTPEYPKDMFAFDATDTNRLYSGDLSDIVVPPERAIGRGLEVAMLCDDGRLKWSLIKPMPAPRGLVAMSNRKVSWFAWHYREIQEGARDEYIRRPLPLSGGRVPLMKALGWKGLDPHQEQKELEEQLALTLSVFEDAHRADAILASVEEAARLTFPVGADAYKSFFSLRDGLRDTPTGRRNPILHWCREHMRPTTRGVTPVVGHDRGKAELVHGNLRLTLRRSEGYAPFLEQNEAET